MDFIIDAECTNNSCLAYFPILYRNVTVRIKEGILNTEFENNQWMEALDVLFANQYHISLNKEEVLESHDTVIATLAEKLICQKSWFLIYLVKIIYFFENKNIPEVVAVPKKD